MPAGVTWPQYLKFMTCAMLSMLAGSQIVHMYYRPLDDLEIYIKKELENQNVALEHNIKSGQKT